MRTYHSHFHEAIRQGNAVDYRVLSVTWRWCEISAKCLLNGGWWQQWERAGREQSFLGSWQSLNCSMNPLPPVMEPASLSRRSRKPQTESTLQPGYFNQLTPYFVTVYVLVLWVDIVLFGLLISVFPRQMKAVYSAEIWYQSNRLHRMSTQHCKGKGLPVICRGDTEWGSTPRLGRFPRAQEPGSRL